MTFYPDKRKAREGSRVREPRLFLVRPSQRSEETTIVQRDHVTFREGFVVFSNGPDYSVPEDVVALAVTPKMVVEEITELPPKYADPATDERASNPPEAMPDDGGFLER